MAISIGAASLPNSGADPALYKLVTAENIIDSTGSHLWRLRFKLRILIPKTDGTEIGAGGEVFVEVNLTTLKAELCRYGE